MSQAIGIGYFQFDNLVRNRIPMFVVSLGAPVGELYQSLELEHLKRHMVELRPEATLTQILQETEKRQLRKMDAVLLICEDGKVSQSLAAQVEAAGFTNSYFVTGGFESLKAEAHAQESF